MTHHLHYLQQCDFVIVMDQGKIVEQGRFSDLFTANGNFTNLMKEFGGMESDSEDSMEQDLSVPHDYLKPSYLERRGSKYSQRSAKSINKEEDDKIISRSGKALIIEEEREVGAISLTIYNRYVKYAGGHFLFLTLLVTLVLAQGSRIATDVWCVHT